MKIGIIGGSGLDDPHILTNTNERTVNTRFGSPHLKIVSGNIGNNTVYIVARHGKDHSVPPSNVNYRAHIWALRELGCTAIFATTAVGSLRESIKPGDVVFPDNFLDFTRFRKNTFHDDSVVHTPMHSPFDLNLRTLLTKEAKKLSIPFHEQGTVVTIEGPRFSSSAESHMFRAMHADIINMSTCPEVILANEAGIPYQAIAMSTDYDSWKQDEEPVTWELVQKRMSQNAETVTKLLVNTIHSFS
ncbi:S-methyl-5'-thioadenosine phosphorylase [Patescibacteria group bacterium]|nr:S-methyl-5'-thioadenosine phosphorylase [Patescibacteria group bacterium]